MSKGDTMQTFAGKLEVALLDRGWTVGMGLEPMCNMERTGACGEEGGPCESRTVDNWTGAYDRRESIMYVL